MNIYIDSSAVLRILFGETASIPPQTVKKSDTLVSSYLLKTECLRVVDRYRLLGSMTPDQNLEVLEKLHSFLKGVRLIPLLQDVLEEASRPLPGPLGTLDALHLASMRLHHERIGTIGFMITHDEQLAKVVRASGFHVIGVSPTGSLASERKKE